MNFVKKELEKIELALRGTDLSGDRYCQLYAAQQALAWVLDQDVAAAPSDTVIAGKVLPLRALGQAQEVVGL